MKCPNCEETLAMTDRQGIEIDYCPKCRGVWLDKGELDKIIEKSMVQDSSGENHQNQNQQNPIQQNPNYNDPYNQGGYGGGGHHGSKHGGGYNKHGRKGFLGNLFDF